jgi:DNA-binding NtrC family response regulator
MELASSRRGGGPVSASRRALIVDDDRSFAESIGQVLGTLHWNVDIALDGATALSRAMHGGYSVILLDLRLDGDDGVRVLRKLQSVPGSPAVIVLSGYLDVSSALEVMKAGAADMFEKPVDIRHLAKVMDRHDPWFASADGRRSSASRHEPAPHSDRTSLPEILGASPAMRLVREQISTVARYRDLSVMIVGETGTGKELVAQAIQRLSGSDGSFVALNCAAVPEDLFESELFGHESGAFTGAQKSRSGLLEAAGRGSVFLDEVGEMPLNLQAKLLRVLETRSFRRVGSNTGHELRARVVSATNRELRGRPGEPMRSDLFFRLAGYTIRTPPLRDRMEDVELLARHFLTGFAAQYGGRTYEISPRALDALRAHDWPGNVRELRSVIQFSAVHAHGDVIGVKEIVEALRARGSLDASVKDQAPRAHSSPPPSAQSLGDLERRAIADAYQKCNGNLSLAARRLRIPRTTLADKLKKYGLR